jgi:NADPH-dependent 2,4-dienoyl-CoA reductase/sulfur reductase-like enzyme
MRIIIIGGVAGGTTAATNARRYDKDAEIVLYEAEEDISYAACGFPYFLGGRVTDMKELAPRGPEFFRENHRVEVLLSHRVESIDSLEKTLTIRDVKKDRVFQDSYDSLIIATGATPFLPPLEGKELPHVFTLRTVQDALQMKSFLTEHCPRRIVIAGSGFIGLELLENLKKDDNSVTVVEKGNKITPVLDQDMADYLEEKLLHYSIDFIKGTAIQKIDPDFVHLDNGESLRADMVILSIGVRPNVALAKEAGVALGEFGAISVDKHMETSLPSIYACGDCVETFNIVTGKPVYRPLGTTANKTGRIAGENAAGNRLSCRGNLGTGILKVFDYTVGVTGLSEREALAQGFDVITLNKKLADRPRYFGGSRMQAKIVADRKTGRLLGAQIIGRTGVDKRIDVLAVLITQRAVAEDLFHLDLAYAPPFSVTKDPVHVAGMGLEEMLSDDKD